MAVENVFMTKSPRKNVPDVGIELGAACMPSEHASDRAAAPVVVTGQQILVSVVTGQTLSQVLVSVVTGQTDTGHVGNMTNRYCSVRMTERYWSV